jgi:FAD/FMN-containing dehydrogenase
MMTVHVADAVQKLRDQLAGTILLPGDDTYELTRRAWNLLMDHRPAIIVVPANAQDVRAAVICAHRHGLGVAVQSTGHGIQHPADDQMLIVTSRMKAVTVDESNRTAQVEAGVIWQEVLEHTAPHGLAPLLGTSPHVGVIGYTLGGGVGFLARRYGLAADHVRWLDIVTPNGELQRASSTENSDLFWALRGGGGNFGVVTAMEFDLVPVARIYGGNMVYPGELARDALGFYREWTAALPDAMTSSMAVMKFPSVPQMPEIIRGTTQVVVRAVYTGDAAEGAALIQQWFDWRVPMSSTFREMPFAEIGTVNNDPVAPSAGYGSNEMFDHLSDEALDIITRRATDSASPLVFAELRHAGGAIADAQTGLNAVGNRGAQYYFQLGGPIFTPDGKAASMAYIQVFKAELQPYLRGGVYLNFMSGREAADRAADAFEPENWERLRALKARYDPDNLFRFSYQLAG